MLTFPIPQSLNGGQFEKELAEAAYQALIYIEGDKLVVAGKKNGKLIGPQHKKDVEARLEAHVPAGPPEHVLRRRRAAELLRKRADGLQTPLEEKEMCALLAEIVAP